MNRDEYIQQLMKDGISERDAEVMWESVKDTAQSDSYFDLIGEY